MVGRQSNRGMEAGAATCHCEPKAKQSPSGYALNGLRTRTQPDVAHRFFGTPLLRCMARGGFATGWTSELPT